MIKRLGQFAAWMFVDTMFFRVCMFISGATVAGGLYWSLAKSWPVEVWAWIFLAPLAMFGASLMLLPFILDDARFERAMDLLSDGGEIGVVLFFVVVLLLAIPITIVLRLIKGAVRMRSNSALLTDTSTSPLRAQRGAAKRER